ncbi:MAG: succinylglutamate-semialdehyde dehydrogenase [Phycisphaeraceae bacterium]
MENGLHLIGGRWVEGSGAELRAQDPWSLEATWVGAEASGVEVDRAVMGARAALAEWSGMGVEARVVVVRRFAALAAERAEDLAEAVARESGKPMWEARGEVALIGAKIETSIAEHERQLGERVFELPNGRGVARYRAHGVLAVLGPFNFPVHLPNGHITPALLAGNTVVFKPSEKTPTAGMLMAELWQAAGAPAGVVSAVVGGRATGEALVAHEQVDGVLFTGSYGAGRAIAQRLVAEPGKIVALELGGNNPIVVDRVGDVEAAAYTVAVSAFSTAGQRCNCARRVILTRAVDRDAFVDRLLRITRSIRVGAQDAEPASFCGPVISPEAGRAMLAAQEGLVELGARVLEPVAVCGAHDGVLRPGVLDVSSMVDRLPDEEHFGPLLRVMTADDLEGAIELANRTRYGLAASLLTDEVGDFERFVHSVRAGVINLNGPTVGASGKLPFGGVGRSGNHRPSAAAAAGYCAFPVASIEAAKLAAVEKPLPGIEVNG